MWKIAWYEAVKVCQRRAAVGVALGLLVASCIATHYQANRADAYGLTMRDEYAVCLQMSGLDNAERLEWLESEADAYYVDLFGGGGAYRPGMDLIYRSTVDEVEAALAYGDFLAGIDEQAEAMSASTLFGRPGSFTLRNIERTPQAYAHLKGMLVPHDYSGGVLLLTDSRLQDAFLYLAVAVLAMYLTISERDEGTLPLVKATAMGRDATIRAKAAVLLAVTAALSLLFYAANMGVVLSELGLGALGRPIQSVQGYLTSPYRITVAGYLVLFPVARALAACAVASVLFGICVVCRNTVYSALLGTSVMGTEALLALGIRPYSALSPLALANLAAITDIAAYFRDYRNMNLLGYPVNVAAVGLATAALAVAAGLGVGFRRFATEDATAARRVALPRLPALPLPRFGGHTTLLRHEAYKLLWVNRAGLVLALFVAFQAWGYAHSGYVITQEEYYYQGYCLVLEGGPSADKRAYVDSERLRLDTLEDQRQAIMDRFGAGEISFDYMGYLLQGLEVSVEELHAFDRSYAQYGYLEEESAGGGGLAFVSQTGWEALAGPQSAADTLAIYAWTAFVLIVSLSAVGSGDVTTGMAGLIPSTLRGRRAAPLCRAALSALLAVAAAAASLLPKVAAVFDAWPPGPAELDAPARSLAFLSWVPPFVTLPAYLAVCIAICLAASILAAWLILLISRRTGSTVTTMLVSSALLLLPPLALILLG